MILKYYFFLYYSLIFSFRMGIDTVNPMFVLHWFRLRTPRIEVYYVSSVKENRYICNYALPQLWIVYRTTKHLNRVHWESRQCNSLEILYGVLLCILTRHHTSKCASKQLRKSYIQFKRKYPYIIHKRCSVKFSLPIVPIISNVFKVTRH